MTDEAKRIDCNVKEYRRYRRTLHTQDPPCGLDAEVKSYIDEKIKDVATDFAVNAIQDVKDGIYIFRYPIGKYDFDMVRSVFNGISETLSSKKVIAIPDDTSITEASKDDLVRIIDLITKVMEEWEGRHE